MKHKTFISFKTEDLYYKDYILKKLDLSIIDKSLNERIESDDEEYIIRKIRKEYIQDSTVTILLIGQYSSEDKGVQEQIYIKREMQASLYNGGEYKRNGILGVVLPCMYDTIYKGPYDCRECGNTHNYVGINDRTVIKEFSANYYINTDSERKCSWSEDDRYCVLVKWEDFILNTNSARSYIEKAFMKREHPISKKVKVYPK